MGWGVVVKIYLWFCFNRCFGSTLIIMRTRIYVRLWLHLDLDLEGNFFLFLKKSIGYVMDNLEKSTRKKN